SPMNTLISTARQTGRYSMRSSCSPGPSESVSTHASDMIAPNGRRTSMSIQPRGVLLSLALSCAAFGPASAAPPADKPATAPYGRWESPISAAMVAEQSLSLGELVTEDGNIFWVEQRPDEGGRNAIVRYANGKGRDINPEPFNARNRVHEYG